MFVKNIDRLKKISRSALCNRCGTCVGLSEGKIAFEDRTGKYRPVIQEQPDDEMAQRIWNACSGKGFDFPYYRASIYGKDARYHSYIGAYRQLFIGHTTNPDTRLNAASGGIISEILIYLLEKGRIDGAVVLGMSEKEPWLTQPFIATTTEDILRAAQSKYIISSVNEILPEIQKFKGTLAYVGLPGQVQAIRLLQHANDPVVRNIKYIFGPFYGNTLHFSSVKSFLRSHGVKDYRMIRKLYFRYGEWPGNMRVELTDGRTFELPKFHANYLIPFHILKNSLLCTDLSNEYTDISGGDAWAPAYEERGKGFSMLISRSEQGDQLLQEMVRENRLKLTPIPEKEAIEMHSHGYDLKKRGTFIRLRFRKWFGMKNPDYGYLIKGFSFNRYIMEVILDTMFFALGSGAARFIVERFSPGFIGKFFEKSRKIWKTSTHNIKRDNLIT